MQTTERTVLVKARLTAAAVIVGCMLSLFLGYGPHWP
jgi:hypothetical protein